MQTLSPQSTQEMLRSGTAALIDIRSANDFAREHIALSSCVSADQLAQTGAAALPEQARGKALVFTCRSGISTRVHEQKLLACAEGCACYMLEGGLNGWKQAGLPVVQDRRQPLELMRQVQIAAGCLILLGMLLGFMLSPWFFGITVFVGAGLLFAGITGFCGMALLLAKMPWNRKAFASPPVAPPSGE